MATVLRVVKKVSLFILVQAIVFSTFSIGMIYYGPFKNIREMIVTTAMTTFSHQYIATFFLSDEKINEIMERNKIDYSNKESDETAIQAFKPSEAEDKIELVDISNGKYKGYMLIVSNPERVGVGVSKKIGSVGMKLDEMVRAYDAVGGINAGGFADDNGKGSGGAPTGILIENGKVISGSQNEKYDVIGFTEDSKMLLGHFTVKQALEKKIRDAVTFGPFLIVNGEPMIKQGSGGAGLQPRTVIGQRRDGAVLMLVIDGRQIGSVGATLKEAQDIMLKYDAYNAANLDGGSSTTMVYDGKIVNKPCSSAGPRYLPSAFIIKKSSGSNSTLR